MAKVKPDLKRVSQHKRLAMGDAAGVRAAQGGSKKRR